MSTVSKLQVSDDVVNRIRDSRDDRDNELAGIGIRYGREWAKNEAEHQHLVNIEANLQPLGDDHADPNSIARVIETGRSDNDSTHFWEEVLGEDSPDLANISNQCFLQGFLCGAMEVWEQVKERL